jgi:signal transduction histidine kinase
LGFTSALSWQTQEFEKKTGIRCDFICKNKDIKLKEDQSNALFRIVQEALTNIFRHAHATHASVILEEKNRMIRLTISDDGIGIAKERMNSLDSLGLVGIRERLHFLKGKLDIKGIKGEGTTLIVTVPLENKGNK